MKHYIKSIITLLICLLVCTPSAFGTVKLPRLVSDGMVLQRDIPVKVWGWADAGETVTIDFDGATYTSAAGTDGKWTIELPPLKAGGPYSMEIHGTNHISLKNILIGDVWVCSGQSNMELPMDRVKDKYPDVIAQCENDGIRQFLVPDRCNFKSPQDDFESGEWISANPQSILQFTAVGYFFARDLYEKYHVPVGLINASLGGSPAQAWMSQEALGQFPNYLEIAEKYKDDAYIQQVKDKDKAVSDAWYDRLDELDAGRKAWYKPDYDASEWATMKIPGYWADEGLGQINGVVWFRKEVTVPGFMVGKPARITLGCIVDADTVYINGKAVGTTSYQYPPRKYDFAPGILKEGKNIIAIRVINNTGRGGFVKDKAYELTAAGQTLDLKGPWQYKVGAVMDPLPGSTFIQWQPLGLYNGMLAPLLNCSIKGVIWYQGESNTGNPAEYQKLFPAMIADWRKNWNQGDFPFLYVQLANFMAAKDQPSESNWAATREAQLKTLSVPNTAMAVITDIGEWNDIHPLNKEDVGKRLSLAAQKLAYGEKDVVYSGPVYQSMRVEGNKCILTFSHIGSGLTAKGDGPLKYFAIAGADKKFVWAQAKIENDKVVVWNDQIENPVAVHYAWADNPEGANLYNKEGLPASCFRTDESVHENEESKNDILDNYRKMAGKDYFEIHCHLSGGMRAVNYSRSIFDVHQTFRKPNQTLTMASLYSFVEVEKKTQLNKDQEQKLRDWIIKHNIINIKSVSNPAPEKNDMDAIRYPNSLNVYIDSKEYSLDDYTIRANPELFEAFKELFTLAKEFTATINDLDKKPF